jgi:NAD+ synthase (glutamine-hydrolysing)
MKIGLAQINTANGDLSGNEKKIRQFLEKARAEKVDLTIFPELSLVGYPPRDFLFQHGFVEQIHQIVQKLAKDFLDLHFILGGVEKNSNVAFVISGGTIKTICKKNLLPNYDVFDERRYFNPGSEPEIVEISGKKIGVTICEDIWAQEIQYYNHDPIQQFKGKALDLVVNLSASPFELHKHKKRINVVSSAAKLLSKSIVYVNLVGGNDELIFDGGSFVVNAQGEQVAQAPFFEESFYIHDLENTQPIPFVDPVDEEKLAKALTLGFRDFVRKCGFQDVTFGLSGGIDSALILLLAVEALGKDHVFPIFMPSRYTSQASKQDVSEMINTLQLQVTLAPITDPLEAYEKSLASSFDEELKRLTVENIQSRIRASILMAFSGQRNAMVINTGNKTESAVGYCTLYGDTIGGVAPIADLYKHQVYAVAKYLNQKHQAIPERVFTRAPSAELAPDQKDSDSIPEYEILDSIVRYYIENNESVQELVQRGFLQKDVDQAIDLITKSEFKRRQTAPILRVSEKAFGTGRRMPIARRQYDL